MLDQDEINLVLNKPWAADGKHFSERIWGDRRAELVQELNKSLRKMLVTGENPVKLAPEIKKKFNVSKMQAERLLRTEDAYFAEEATYNSYKECGTGEYEIIATLDYKTSEICQEMDGKHFPVEKKKTGVNYPPFHPNCRTTTAPYIDDPELTEGDTRIARNSEGKNYYVPANMTYKEWYESLGSEERAAFVRQSKMDKNRKTDKEQYERYKKVLGKENVPKTFDKFVSVKYNGDKAEYESLKLKYSDKRIQERIRNSYNLTIHEGKQGKHILEHNNYIPGRSYLTVSMQEAQELVNQYAGTGEIQRDQNGKWSKKELVRTEKIIGKAVENGSIETETNKFIIYYSKKGVHIAPTTRNFRSD